MEWGIQWMLVLQTKTLISVPFRRPLDLETSQRKVLFVGPWILIWLAETKQKHVQYLTHTWWWHLTFTSKWDTICVIFKVEIFSVPSDSSHNKINPVCRLSFQIFQQRSWLLEKNCAKEITRLLDFHKEGAHLQRRNTLISVWTLSPHLQYSSFHDVHTISVVVSISHPLKEVHTAMYSAEWK